MSGKNACCKSNKNAIPMQYAFEFELSVTSELLFCVD